MTEDDKNSWPYILLRVFVILIPVAMILPVSVLARTIIIGIFMAGGVVSAAILAKKSGKKTKPIILGILGLILGAANIWLLYSVPGL